MFHKDIAAYNPKSSSTEELLAFTWELVLRLENKEGIQ